MGVSKNRAGPPKWMVYNGSKPYEQMDDLEGFPIFLVQHPSVVHLLFPCWLPFSGASHWLAGWIRSQFISSSAWQVDWEKLGFHRPVEVGADTKVLQIFDIEVLEYPRNGGLGDDLILFFLRCFFFGFQA